MDEQLQQQIQALVAAAMQGDQQAQQQIQQIMQAAQQGNQQAQQIAMLIQEELQNAQGGQGSVPPGQEGVGYAKKGAKLNYINYLRGKCPEGYEIGYFKKGGHLCKACMKKKKMQEGAPMPEPQSTDAVEAFKCGRKTRKPKCQEGQAIEMNKCGGKQKKPKAACGKKLPIAREGYEMNTIVRSDLGKGVKQQNVGGEYRTIALGDTIYSYFQSPTGDVVDYKNQQMGKQNWDNAAKGAKKGKTTVITPGDNLRRPAKKEFGGPFVPFTNRGLR